MGILLNQQGGAKVAASAAAAAGKQAMGGGRWAGLHVYVFADRESASAFRLAQRRGGRRPTRAGMNALLRYELTRDGRQKITFPGRSGTGG